MHGAQADVAGRRRFAAGKAQRIVERHGFRRPFPQPAKIVAKRSEAPHVDRPQVHSRLPFEHPFGERPADAAAARHAHGVHTATEEEPAKLGRLAEQETVVGGETLGAVQQHARLGVMQRRDAVQRPFHDRLEVVPVLVQQVEGEVAWQVSGVDGLGVRLETAD